MIRYQLSIDVEYHDDLDPEQVRDRIYGSLMARSESTGLAHVDIRSVANSTGQFWERAVQCQGCRQMTWNRSALCDVCEPVAHR